MGGHDAYPAPKQRFSIRYGLSPNAQNPFKGVLYNTVFNTFRRTKSQFLFVLVPVGSYWYLWKWSQSYNEWLYTKAGRETLLSYN